MRDVEGTQNKLSGAKLYQFNIRMNTYSQPVKVNLSINDTPTTKDDGKEKDKNSFENSQLIKYELQ